MPTHPAAGLRAPDPGRPVARRASRTAAARAPWGWLELVVLAQGLIPVLLFVPGLTPLRMATRVAVFVVAVVAWAAVLVSGRRAPGRPFPAAPWLAGISLWLVASILHPTTNSPMSGMAQAALNVAVLSAAFWGGAALRSPRQIARLMALLLLCNGASTLVGIGQIFWPERLTPASIPLLEMNPAAADSLMITTVGGRKVLRPCGLSDTPGGAAQAGFMACLIGLSMALRPIGRLRRSACFGVALAGVAVIYFSQVRSTLMTLAICLAALVGLLAYQRDYRRSLLVAAGGLAAFLLSFAWAMRTGGERVLARFVNILEVRPDQLYYSQRGYFLEQTFGRFIWEFPLGAGLGRWGMMYFYFGDHAPSTTRGAMWCEIQWTGWTYDGGIPLLIAYPTAMALAIVGAARVGRSCPDESIRFWSAPIAAIGLSFLVLCFGSVPFVNQVGVQFWVLLAALHAAAERARLQAKAARA